MDHPTYNRIIASVQQPIAHFLETGFWNPHSLEGFEECDISEQQVRSSCRALAKALKRPFIICQPNFKYGERDAKGVWRPLDNPFWRGGFLSVPKLKRHAPIVAPFLLAANGEEVSDHSGETLWEFQVTDHQLWVALYDHILNDPDCRKARRLTS